MLKSHNCGELRREHAGTRVTLAGWVHRRRDHGNLIFIDLRDREGITQVVFNPEISELSHKIADQLRNEFVISATGMVTARPTGTENPDLPTGEVEVAAEEICILNSAKTPPFYINEDTEVDESLTLRFRYLDLRRQRTKENIILRTRVVRFMRDFLEARGFLDIETPIMTKSTPEGARDYLIPSRLYPGKFYALPQSPQQMKQLLMVGGMEKYYQIAKCFRDEDTRADRQPEFTQLDVEMSFVDEDDVIGLFEDLFTNLMEQVKPELRMIKPFPQISYAEAMEKYGSDKPDLRFGLEIQDLSDIAGASSFEVFRNIINSGGKVKGVTAPGCGGYSRGQIEELTKFVHSKGARGMVSISLGAVKGPLAELTGEDVKSVVSKYLSLEQIKQMASRLDAAKGDLILLIAGQPEETALQMGELRKELGRRLGLVDPALFVFAWVRDFPLLEKNPETGRWQSVHHPFTMPREDHVPLLDTSPEKVHGKHYDLICNGFELGGGSIRIHITGLQKRIFEILGYSETEMYRLFGQLLEAFEYGAPPHGGIAAGLDRFVMLLAGAPTIRQVIPFPKNQNGVDMIFDAPAEVSEAQLKELNITFRNGGKK